ncbi:hypothetical protein [Streptomyces sp. NPDC014656]|uniref:hypothetical protein n=1 Tax=Streptomyces sp. NPDC014656 TaxID=3364878 RepID=UPI0036F698CC
MEQLTGEDPAHIGPYRLIARLGAGGMGLVCPGRSDLGRTVAVPALLSASFTGARERRGAFGAHLAIAGSGPALGLPAGWFLSAHPNWHFSLFAGIPFALVALIGAAVRVQDRPGRAGARFDGRGLLLASYGIAGAPGAVAHFTGAPVALAPASVLLLVVFMWWQTGPADALASAPASASGPAFASGGRRQAPAVCLPVMAVVTAGVAALLVARGYV